MVNDNDSKFTKTDQKIKIGNRERIIYKGSRGGKYIKDNGKYVNIRNRIKKGGAYEDGDVKMIDAFDYDELDKIDKFNLEPTKDQSEKISSLYKRLFEFDIYKPNDEEYSKILESAIHELKKILYKRPHKYIKDTTYTIDNFLSILNRGIPFSSDNYVWIRENTAFSSQIYLIQKDINEKIPVKIITLKNIYKNINI